jgi:acetyl-CoA acetyltransferase
VDAIVAAVEDAGLTRSDIDGLTAYPGLAVGFTPGYSGPDLYDVQDSLGFKLKWHQAQSVGPPLQLHPAVFGVSNGLCRHVVIYRTVTEATGQAGGGRPGWSSGSPTAVGSYSWLLPMGAVSPANWAALYAQRHMAHYGTTKEQLGWVAVTQRAHASRNPDAIYRNPLTLQDYLSARPISTPLGLYDCDVPVDASTAFVISSAETTSDLRHPVRIESMAGGTILHRPFWEQWEDLSTMATHDAAGELWSRTTLRAADVDVAQLYDGFSIFVLFWLEALGLCPQGEAGTFIEGGSRITFGGTIPVNTWGGQLSGGRLHAGFGHVAEAVRQIRGEAGARQVDGVEVSLATCGGGYSAGAILLTK